MDKRNKTALAYLLIGVAAAGRALLSVPENAAIQEVSLTVLALVGYLLLASKSRLPVLFGAAGLVLELILSGVPAGGASVWLIPALRVADLWLFWGASVVLLRLAGRQGAVPCGAAAGRLQRGALSARADHTGGCGLCGVQRPDALVCSGHDPRLQRCARKKVTKSENCGIL